jgi:hypothetical protein
MEIFIVVWSGGWEAPSLFVSKDKEKAVATYDEWMNDAEEGDIISMYATDGDTITHA